MLCRRGLYLDRGDVHSVVVVLFQDSHVVFVHIGIDGLSKAFGIAELVHVLNEVEDLFLDGLVALLLVSLRIAIQLRVVHCCGSVQTVQEN